MLGIHAGMNFMGLKIFKNNGIPLTGGLGVIGGSLGGCLLGIGVANLLDLKTEREIYWTLTIGGWAGFIPTYIMAKNMGGSGSTGLLIKPEIQFARGKTGYGVQIYKMF